MPNITITNNDLGGVVLSDASFRDELLDNFAPKTFSEGTILARSASTGNLVPFETDNDVNTPCAILTYEITRDNGPISMRAMIAGKVRKERLVIDDGSTIDNIILDQLREYGLVAIDVQELNFLDNQ